MNTYYIRGTFSPSLDGDCSWTLLDAAGNIIASGPVTDLDRTTLTVALPGAPSLANPYELHVGPCQLAKVIDQAGGIVIVDTVMIHEYAPLRTATKATLPMEKKRN